MDLDRSCLRIVLPIDDIAKELLDMSATKHLSLEDMLIGWIKDRMYVEVDLNTPDSPR